jgi:hypothetical protein
MPAYGFGMLRLTALSLLAAVAVTGCTGLTSTPAATVTATVTVSPTASGAAQSNGPASASSAATPTGSPTGSPTSSGTAASNLVVSDSLLAQLAQTYAAYKQIPTSDLAGGAPTAGSVYYAYDPTTMMYWAMAGFKVSSTAPPSVTANFVVGGDEAFFSKAGTGPWELKDEGAGPPECKAIGYFPHSVLTAWAIPTTEPATC